MQYTKKDWRSRNRIRTKEGWIWLTVPVLTKGRYKQLIKDVRIDNSTNWARAHLNALKINYPKAGYFKDYIGFFEQILQPNWDYLLDLDCKIILFLARQFSISTRIMHSSELSIVGLSGSSRIIEICRRLNANELYDSAGAKSFLDLTQFEEEGIKITFQDFQHPVYKQVYPPFIPYMSAVDLLFNEGPQGKNIISSGNRNRNQ